MQAILVIGATGSTGPHLTKYLNDENFLVYATGLKPRSRDYFGMNNVIYVQLDISKKDDFELLPTNFDAVVLLAGAMPARMKGYDPYEYVNVNITGTLNVLEFCRLNKIKKLIFAQTHSDVSGHWNTGEQIAADASRSINLKGDHAMYVISKCAAADMVEHYHQEYDMQTIVLRLPTIYCNWPAANFYVDGKLQDMAYMYLINKAIKGEQLEVWGDPTATKDIVYIKDFVCIVKNALESRFAQGTYNVGSGIGTSLDDQIKGMVEVFSPQGKASEIIYKPEKRTQVSYLYDISRTQRELRYKTKYPYKKMLLDMKAEINAQD
jgi:UDP-glucose 4-epimerase